jgi:hypothetical protein
VTPLPFPCDVFLSFTFICDNNSKLIYGNISNENFLEYISILNNNDLSNKDQISILNNLKYYEFYSGHNNPYINYKQKFIFNDVSFIFSLRLEDIVKINESLMNII